MAQQDVEAESEATATDQSLQKPPEKAPVNPWHPSQYPDGGYKAWMVTAGAFSCVFCSFDWINCIGIFQDYYQSHQLRSYSSSTISWIASLELFIMFAGGPIVGRFYDTYGPRYIILIGTFFHVFGLMMTSICKEYYQILLAQGICSAIGTSCLFSPATNCMITWFHKKRAFAIGIVAGGSSIGGVIFPVMLNHLIRELGFGWAIRIAAFMILGILVFGNLTLSSRLPPSPKELRLVQYFAPLRERTYLLTTVGSFLFYLGMFLPINYIQYQAMSYGMSETTAEYLIPILNAASLFGRILPGWIGDKVGRYNTQIATCLFSGVIALALWIPAKQSALLFVFAALYGFGSGAFVSLLPAIIAQISDVREIGFRVGMEFAVMSVAALVSNPIGGALIDHDHGGFRDLQIFCGVVLLVGSGGFVLARLSLEKRVFAVV